MKYAIGIDVGGTTIKVGVVGTDARIYHQFSVDTPQGADNLVSCMPTLLARVTRDISLGAIPGVSPDDVIPTVGIDVPGIVNEHTGIAEFSANLHWRDFDAQTRFEKVLNRPVAFGHDVRNGALAESYWGVALPHFFYIAIGTGIASVLIINNQPISPHPWAGEIGQIPVTDPDDEGATRPLEQVCSASAIARRAHEKGLIGSTSGANEVYRIADGSMSVTQAGGTSALPAAQAQLQAHHMTEEALEILARSIAPALAAFGSIPVVIGGGLANEGQAMLERLSNALTQALGIIPAPQVLLAQLGSQSQVLGAALRAFLAHGCIDTSQES